MTLRITHISVLILAVVLLAVPAFLFAGGGFDEFGYNRDARIFNGLADGVDEKLDELINGGSALYANDRLKMKWNSEWDRGNEEDWTDVNGYDAWIDNQWNGKVRDGSGETWSYMIKWVGPCPTGADGPNGGYCIWSQFEVILSHGTFENEHLWDVLAQPAGFGN